MHSSISILLSAHIQTRVKDIYIHTQKYIYKFKIKPRLVLRFKIQSDPEFWAYNAENKKTKIQNPMFSFISVEKV